VLASGSVHATWDDVHAELCDVEMLTPDTAEIFAKCLEHVAGRSLVHATPITE
jgi:hypothetical protein